MLDLSKVFNNLAVRILLVPCLLLFSNIHAAVVHDESLMIGGARADTNVKIGWLSKNAPTEVGMVRTYKPDLPRDWGRLSDKDKGTYAEKKIARSFFLSLDHTNGRNSNLLLLHVMVRIAR